MIPIGVISKKSVPTDPNLLTGMTYIDLPSPWTSVNNDHSWKLPSGSGGQFAVLNIISENDSIILFKASSLETEVILCLTNADTGNNLDLGSWANNDQYYNNGGSGQVNFSGITSSMYLGFRRVGSSLTIVRTTDGISYTQLASISQNYRYLGIWVNSSNGRVDYLQGQGFSTI